ncbi:MAG TPA: hypothetical protein VF798_07035 [Burkholderiaceae bacterium]
MRRKMHKVQSSQPFVPAQDADSNETADTQSEDRKSSGGGSQAQSHHLQALGRLARGSSGAASASSVRRSIGPSASKDSIATASASGESPKAAPSLRKRRTDGEPSAPELAAPAASSGARDTQMPLARRVGNTAMRAAYRVWQGYVGMLAISAGYRTLRNPGEALRHPVATMGGIISFGERIAEQTIQQGKADVLDRHGAHIPTDSACHNLEPRISYDLPMGTSGRVTRGGRSPGDMEPVDFELNRFAPNGGGLHAVHHEYLHCFTHPKFAKAMRHSPHWRTIEEALTEHFADQLPGHAIGKFAPYDLSKLPNGKRWSQAAAELEQAVGTETLHRAYFGGDVDAIQKVSAAVVDIWPKAPTLAAWRSIQSIPRSQRQSLAECYVGAALISTGKLPPDPAPGAGGNGAWAWSFLPVGQFRQIMPKDSETILQQTEALKAKLGAQFDQAFFGFDPDTQGAAMRAVSSQIHGAWKPVL